MRDILIFAIVFGSLPFALKRPLIGVLVFTWLSLMNPHRLAYGSAYDFPFAAIVAIVTLVGIFTSQQRMRFPVNGVTGILMLFTGWMTFTTFFALEPNLAWKEWDRVMKTLFMTFITLAILQSFNDIRAFVWTIAISLGFYGLKGGVFTLASGGTSHVLGPAFTYIGDNNAIALALVTTLPIIWFLRLQAQIKWLRNGLTLTALLTVIAAVGSYSRGALLAGAAMLFFLFMKSRYKVRTALALVLIVPLVYAIMPEKWFDRMETIDDYKQDASAMGRINAWHFGFNVAINNLLGGGFNVFTPKMFHIYAPHPLDFHVAHSIFFQVLGEHGFIGLSLYILLMISAWRTGTRILKFCRGNEALREAFDLAAMCQVSIIGFAVGGAFLSLAYYDLYYNIIAVLIALERYVQTYTTQRAQFEQMNNSHSDSLIQNDPNPTTEVDKKP